MLFFGVNTWVLILLIAVVVLAATAGGLVLGRVIVKKAEERGTVTACASRSGCCRGR